MISSAFWIFQLQGCFDENHLDNCVSFPLHSVCKHSCPVTDNFKKFSFENNHFSRPCVYVYVCMWGKVGVCFCGSLHSCMICPGTSMCVCCEGQRLASSFVLNFWDRVSVNLELADLISLAGQWALEICVSISPGLTVYMKTAVLGL